MDKIIIQNLRLRTIVGVYPEEKKKKRDVIVNLTLFCELRTAGISDKLSDTVDYKSVETKIGELVEKGNFNLIEKIAEEIARICLDIPLVSGVIVRVDKPGVLSGCESVAVEIERIK